VAEREVVLGVSWADGEPMVRRRTVNHSASSLAPLIGMALSYRIEPEPLRHCLGHHPHRSGGPQYVDCPNRPLPDARTCRACAIAEATQASNLHHAHTRADGAMAVGVDTDTANHLRRPNLLYLAGFRDGTVKVGTSTEHRVEVRLAEQGAWRAHIVARAIDGIVVRQVEDAVTEALGIAQSVSATRKLAGLVSPVDDQVLEHSLDTRRGDVHQLLAHFSESVVAPLDQTWAHPRSISNWSGLHRYPASLRTESHDATVVDACGRLVMISPDASADRFVADLRELYGIEFEPGRFGAPTITVQDRLF
jgi:hypothetical protein